MALVKENCEEGIALTLEKLIKETFWAQKIV